MRQTIVCCSDATDPNWKWIAPELKEVNFHFVNCSPRRRIERLLPFNFARLRGSLRAVELAKQLDADIFVAHGPSLTAWCALLGRVLKMKAVVVSYAFNFASLPSGLKTLVFSYALRSVDRFFVFSNVERGLYARIFRLSEQKFEFIHWGVRPPIPGPAPSELKEYVSAIGGNARDYTTLIEAARRLTDIPFVLVARPHNLRNITLPANVTTLFNVSFADSMGVLFHSRFMVLPLINSEVPCGHVTVVAAMHLGKAMLVTASSGVADYVKDDINAVTVPANDIDAMISGIRRLWNDKNLCEQLGTESKGLATKLCDESNVVIHFRKYIEAQNAVSCSVD
jgi:glycosyltransferase involved in cell wall biosynthesis